MNDYFSDLSFRNNNESGKSEIIPSNPQTLVPERLSASEPMSVTPETAAIMGVVEITKESIRCFTEYAKCKEHEITERKRINAALKAVKYQIDAQKELYLHELEKNYEERNRLYDIAEEAHKRALEVGDKEMLMASYSFMLDVYSKPSGHANGVPSLVDGSSMKF